MAENQIDELKIFALTLYFEAGSTCPIQEVLYIAYVIRNRVKVRKSKKTYMDVCLQNRQFSCWNDKTIEDIKKIKLNNNFRFLMCQMVAEYVKDMPDKFMPKEMRGVYYYYNPVLICPTWARKLKRVYPHLSLKHLFLKER